MQEISDELRALRDLKVRRDKLKDLFEAADKDYKNKMSECQDAMEDAGVGSTKVDDTLFVPAETVYGNVQDKAAFIEWAQQQDEALVEPKPRGDLLNALVREHLDDGKPLPPGVGFYVRRYISQRGA